MKKRKVAFILGITPNLAFAAGNVALSLAKHMPDREYEVVVYFSELAPNDLKAFQAIPKCRLVKFSFPDGFVKTMAELSSPSARFKDERQLMTFAHFEAFKLLDEYQNVVWLDADIAIQGDLSAITDYGPFGITSDAPWKVQGNFTDPIPGYNMEALGVCCAVICLHDSLPYKSMYKWCYEKTIEYARFVTNGDQGIINLLLQEYRIDPVLMPLAKWQCISWRDEANVANIVHFGTNRKVWNTNNICDSFPEWYRFHLLWLNLGGSDFDQSRIHPCNVLSRLNRLDELNQRCLEASRLVRPVQQSSNQNFLDSNVEQVSTDTGSGGSKQSIPVDLQEIHSNIQTNHSESIARTSESTDRLPANIGDTVVIIPTMNRPDMLRTALRSVRNQTARSRISFVYVSDNSANGGHTENVCAEFAADLPIRFIHREPSLSFAAHSKELAVTDYGTKYISILHDDDWWSSNHLEHSLDTIVRSNAVACYSSFFNVRDESALLSVDSNALFWFGAMFKRTDQTWLLDKESVYLSFLAATAGRFSTLVARIDAIRETAWIYDLGHPFDTDRMLGIALANRGVVAFQPAPSVYIRWHRGQDSGSYSMDRIEKHMLDTTNWIFAQAAEQNIDVFGGLKKRLALCPPDHLQAVLESLATPWLRMAIQSHDAVPQSLRNTWAEIDEKRPDISAARTRATIIWRGRYEGALALLNINQEIPALRLLLEAIKSIENCNFRDVILDALLEVTPTLARLDRGRALYLADMAIKFAQVVNRPGDLERAKRLHTELNSRT